MCQAELLVLFKAPRRKSKCKAPCSVIMKNSRMATAQCSTESRGQCSCTGCTHEVDPGIPSCTSASFLYSIVQQPWMFLTLFRWGHWHSFRTVFSSKSSIHLELRSPVHRPITSIARASVSHHTRYRGWQTLSAGLISIPPKKNWLSVRQAY